jgi:hypothetical protein
MASAENVQRVDATLADYRRTEKTIKRLLKDNERRTDNIVQTVTQLQNGEAERQAINEDYETLFSKVTGAYETVFEEMLADFKAGEFSTTKMRAALDAAANIGVEGLNGLADRRKKLDDEMTAFFAKQKAVPCDEPEKPPVPAQPIEDRAGEQSPVHEPAVAPQYQEENLPALAERVNTEQLATELMQEGNHLEGGEPANEVDIRDVLAAQAHRATEDPDAEFRRLWPNYAPPPPMPYRPEWAAYDRPFMERLYDLFDPLESDTRPMLIRLHRVFNPYQPPRHLTAIGPAN